MDGKFLAAAAGMGVAAGAVAVLMMPRTCPARRLAAKAANKAEDVVFQAQDKLGEITKELDL